MAYGYKAIREFLEANKYGDALDQFGIDWIEEELERMDTMEEGGVLIDDDTVRGAVHYRAQNVLDIMRAGAKSRTFFKRLLSLTDDGVEESYDEYGWRCARCDGRVGHRINCPSGIARSNVPAAG